MHRREGCAPAECLCEKLLERPRVLEQIQRTLGDQKVAYLLPYNWTALERDIALALDIPLFDADPGHAWLGSKSGSRALFAKAGVPHPLVTGRIRTIPDAVDAICSLRAAKPELAELVIKLDRAVSGEGNARVDLTGLPIPGTRGEGALIQQRLERLVPDTGGVSPAAYLRKLVAQGGVVEERITVRELRSPSVQFEIMPAGSVTLLSTHDQILHGRSGQQGRPPLCPCAYGPGSRRRQARHARPPRARPRGTQRRGLTRHVGPPPRRASKTQSGSRNASPGVPRSSWILPSVGCLSRGSDLPGSVV